MKYCSLQHDLASDRGVKRFTYRGFIRVDLNFDNVSLLNIYRIGSAPIHRLDVGIGPDVFSLRA
jgi:hypothetical protein